jgi:hypothetical protein
MQVTEDTYRNIKSLWVKGRQCISLNRELECFDSYKRSVAFIKSLPLSEIRQKIAKEIEEIENESTINPELSQHIVWLLHLLLYTISNNDDKSISGMYLQKRCINSNGFKKPVIIIAGGAKNMIEEEILKYAGFLTKLLQLTKGSIISGGTDAGIPGLVGKIKTQLQLAKPLPFHLVAYLPEKLPYEAVKSAYYDSYYYTPARDFSVIEVLSYWTDIFLSGIKPEDITLYGINGGKIAALEYRIALVLGAKVYLMKDSGRAVDEIVNDKNWNDQPGMLILTNDPLMI